MSYKTIQAQREVKGNLVSQIDFHGLSKLTDTILILRRNNIAQPLVTFNYVKLLA